MWISFRELVSFAKNLIFGCDNPTFNPSPGVVTEFSHSVMGMRTPLPTITYMEQSKEA